MKLLDIVHRSCILPPLVFVFLIAYDFDVRPPHCFCQLAFFSSACFCHYCLVSHQILTKATGIEISVEYFLTVVILLLLVLLCLCF